MHEEELAMAECKWEKLAHLDIQRNKRFAEVLNKLALVVDID